MKSKLFIAVAFSAAIVGLAAHGQGNGLVPMKGVYKDTRAIQLWPGVAPGSEKDAAVVESWFTAPGDIVARNVTRPTISPFLPAKGKATGAAVIVMPGGGNVVLAMGKEGFEVAKYLADHGIAAFVVKYRTTISAANAADMAPMPGAVGRPSTGAPPAAAPAGGRGGAAPGGRGGGGAAGAPRLGVEDGKQALRWVRAHAKEYGVDPDRIGMVGFSAGAGQVWNVTFDNDPTAKPNFIAPIYGGFSARGTIPANPPPLFVAAAADDNLMGAAGFPIVEQWTKAGGKVELHLYQNGGHGFGALKQGTSSDIFLDQFYLWIKVNGFLKPLAPAKPKA